MPYTETMEMGEESAGLGKLRIYYQVTSPAPQINYTEQVE